MILHYLRIAFRNMWKYRSQTLISVLGLAVGFTCFSLATLWIRYEMTYDSFHKNAKQMYVVYVPSANQTGYSSTTFNPLAAYLKETFPEIADAIPLDPDRRGDGLRGGKVTVEGVEYPALTIRVDSSFFRMFDVKMLEGNRDFLITGSQNRAITQEKARQLFGDDSPLGKKVTMGNAEITICAVVTGMSKRSNYAFDFIGPFHDYAANPGQMWQVSAGDNTIIALSPGTDLAAFEKKLYEHATGEGRGNLTGMTIKPLTKVRYTDANIVRDVKYQHILIFAVSGILVILCSLFNYLTLFVSRFRMRQRELALRVVCGATGGSLLGMLSVEFLLTLSFAIALGYAMTQGVHNPFLMLSEIKMGLPAIFRELLLYVGGVMLVSMLTFWLILFIFRHRSLDVSIRQSNKKMFRKASVVVQLAISIGFAFCTVIILKQMYFLHHTDELGFSFKNSGSVIVYGENSDQLFADRLKQLPEITDVLVAKGLMTLLPESGRPSQDVGSWDGQPGTTESISLERLYVSPASISFYDFQLVTGEMLTDADPETVVLLNESAVKAFGWDNPVGKLFDNRYTVKGVIKHIYNFAPTVQAKPVFYLKPPPDRITAIMRRDGVITFGGTVLFKYREGTWNSCMEKIELFKNEFTTTSFVNAEEEYNKYLKSENALLRLLSFVSVICIVMCVFGFVSLVSLTCEERRKSIAIRKINGATVGDILSLFSKEYFILLIIGAAIAFPAGFIIMQRWLEHYVKQTPLPAWIYVSILFVMALAIVLSVGWQVYKTSAENPAEVVSKV